MSGQVLHSRRREIAPSESVVVSDDRCNRIACAIVRMPLGACRACCAETHATGGAGFDSKSAWNWTYSVLFGFCSLPPDCSRSWRCVCSFKDSALLELRSALAIAIGRSGILDNLAI